jgi:hypothetical protein
MCRSDYQLALADLDRVKTHWLEEGKKYWEWTVEARPCDKGANRDRQRDKYQQLVRAAHNFWFSVGSLDLKNRCLEALPREVNFDIPEPEWHDGRQCLLSLVKVLRYVEMLREDVSDLMKDLYCPRPDAEVWYQEWTVDRGFLDPEGEEESSSEESSSSSSEEEEEEEKPPKKKKKKT